MIHAWWYPNGREREPLDPTSIRDAVDPEKGLVWIDCDDSLDVDAIHDRLDIDPLAYEDVRQAGQRTKLEHYRGHYHVAIHDCTIDGNRVATSEVDLIFGNGWLLSVRHQLSEPRNFAIDEVARRFERQRDPDGNDDEGLLLCAVVDVVVDRYFDVAEAVDDRVAGLQEKVFREVRHPPRETPEEIFLLNKALLVFRLAALPMSEVLRSAERLPVIGPLARDRLHDVDDRALRLTARIDSHQHLVDGLLDADVALRSYAINEVMKSMTSWGAILLGSSLIAGIYGMNFGSHAGAALVLRIPDGTRPDADSHTGTGVRLPTPRLALNLATARRVA